MNIIDVCANNIIDVIVELTGIYVQPGYPCGNFSGYCTEEQYVHIS